METVLGGGRYTALAREPGIGRVWFAGPGGIGTVNDDGTGLRTAEVDAGYIWELVARPGRIWYVGSSGYGWVDTGTLRQGFHRRKEFKPRPFVSDPGVADNFFHVSAHEGLWEISDKGHRLAVPVAETEGSMVAWIQSDGEGFLLGTPLSVFEWSGAITDAPRAIPSNYPEFFRGGIGNAVDAGATVAVTSYPYGVALFDRSLRQVTGYAGRESGLNVGDVYKVREAASGEVLVLGKEGVASVGTRQSHRFFPRGQLWGAQTVSLAVATPDAAYIFSDRNWFAIDDEGVLRGGIPHTAYWGGVDLQGRPFHGSVTGYKRLVDGIWQPAELAVPVDNLVWGGNLGFAVTSDGVSVVAPDLRLTAVLRAAEKLQILGVLGGTAYLLDANGRVSRLSEEGGSWKRVILPKPLAGRFRDSTSGNGGVLAATDAGLYQINGDNVVQLPVETGWQVRGVGAGAGRLYALFENPAGKETAVGCYGPEGARMLAVPHLAEVGDPLGLVANATRIGVVGSKGAGWYAAAELPALATPEVEFDLLLEDKRVQDRIIPSGMHFIDLRVKFSGPVVPSIVQYRINEQRWRTVNLLDPSLQFAGHGQFTVELRAVHPNGNTSGTRVVQFGIAPPWYLNPRYQGAMFLLFLLVVWGLYSLRHAQLKRTNLWLQNEVKKQTRELEAATAARTNFLAGLSHDIRNPLNGVLMIAEALSRNPPKSTDDPRLRDLTEFGVTVDRMLGEILDFSAIDQSNLPTTFTPVSVADIIDSSVKQNQFSIQRQGITVTRSVAPELEHVIIRGDRNWMIKIMANLIINAVEYSGSERIEVGAVCHRLTATGADVEFYVRDWGKGIDASERTLVFERFYRGESGVESGKHGTGLGLSICQDLAHAMGAHLQLEDNHPSGCRFLMKGRFDRLQDAAELDVDMVLAGLQGWKVLVVDDLAYNRRSIVEFMISIGCRCDESDNGHDALARLDAGGYQLALLDWDLPGLTGAEVARRHRRNRPADTVVLFALTAYTDAEKKRESAEAGMNGYIAKPLTSARLAHCLANSSQWNPRGRRNRDRVNTAELEQEIHRHVEECMDCAARQDWENLRRCAHRLTTLALIQDNAAMQRVCRDLQVSAQAGRIDEIQVGLAQLQQWRKS